jgi:Fringe-like
MHEKGLTHVWHEKDCKIGSFVENTFFKSCVGAKAHTEGSPLGLYLRSLSHTDPEHFEALMAVKAKKELPEEDGEDIVDDATTEKVSVMIAVITSRANFGSRVTSIMKTWGNPEFVPDGVTIKFFVGVDENNDKSYSGSDADLENLAKLGGMPDTSMIQVMTDVMDDEYPPVRKNSAMIRHLDETVTSYENDETAPSTFQWAFKVDDDAYVYLKGLLNFVKKRNPVGYHIYGERGYGRKEDLEGLAKGGLVKPYCTGGPGYIFSRPTLKRTAQGMDACVKQADTSPYREYLWHSDVVIGLCAEQQTGAGCWNDDDYDKKRVFRNNYKKQYPYMQDSKLSWLVSMHPFKDEALMMSHHKRYLDQKLLVATTS